MPKYKLPDGRSFSSDQPLSPDELDEIINGLPPAPKVVNSANDAKDPGLTSKILDTAGGTIAGLGKLATAPVMLAGKAIAHPLDTLNGIKTGLEDEVNRASKDSESYFKEDNPVQGVLSAIPFLGGVQKKLGEAIPASPSKNVDYEKIGEEGVAPVIAPKVLPFIAGKAGELAGSAGKSLYSKAFPKNVDPESLKLLQEEGVSGSPKGMASQVQNRLDDAGQEMANLEGTYKGNQNLQVSLDPAKQPLIRRMDENMVGKTGIPASDALDRELSIRLGKLEAFGPSISMEDAINLKRGTEYEGGLAGAYQGKGPLKPGQLAANMVTGGLKKGMGDVDPAYNTATERVGDLIDARKAAESARPSGMRIPHRLTPAAIGAYFGYHMGGVPGSVAGAGVGLGASKLLTSPTFLTKMGLGGQDLGALLSDPSTRDAIMKSILLGQAQNNAQQ